MKSILGKILRFLLVTVKGRLCPDFRLNRYFPFWDRIYIFLTRLAKSQYEDNILGHKMFLDEKDSLELSIFKVYEPFETGVLVGEIPEGSAVVDIGANIGYYTLQFARKVGATGRVYAFEPEPHNFSLLTRNIQVNGYQNVTPLRLAVSNISGPLRLFVSEDNKGDHRVYASDESRETIEIQAIRLDDYFRDGSSQIRFIKMDIQGAEYHALSGMLEVLNKWRDVVLVTEFWPYGLQKAGSDPEKFVELLLQQGFKLFEICEGEHRLKPFQYSKPAGNLPPEFGNSTNLLCRRS